MSGASARPRTDMKTRFGRRKSAARGAPFARPDLIAPRKPDAVRTIAVLAYTGVTTAEMDVPIIKLAEGLHADVVYVGHTATTVVGIEPVRTVHLNATFDDPVGDVLVIPGGLGWKRIAEDTSAMEWLAAAAERASGILAISTGSLILASAGRLAGQRATGHWLARESLAELGAEVTTERITQSADGRVVTASGALAAIEVCDELANRLAWGT